MNTSAKKLLLVVFAAMMVGCSSEKASLRQRMMVHKRARMEKRGHLVVEEDYQGINTGQDFSKPFARVENIYRYQRVNSDLEASSFIHRLYVPYRLESGWTFSGLYEIPLAYTNIPSRDNPNGDYEFGLGDISTQFLFIRPTESRWTFAGGALFTWPTASQDQMGLGKYVAGPTVGVSYHPENWESGGYVGALVSELFDFEGKSYREDVHQLLLQPFLSYNFDLEDAFWFTTFSPELRVDWEQDNGLFLPIKMTVGRVFYEDMVITSGFSVPVVNDVDLYDWQIEIGISYFF